LFPDFPRCRIPRNFYNDLLTTTLSPDIFQLFTLSAVSGYRISDWLALFGFSAEEIPRLQLALPGKRTVLVDATRYREHPEFSWCIPQGWVIDPVCPLLRFLRTIEIRRIQGQSRVRANSYLYARVGREDAFAFPNLLVGSLLRIDTTRPERYLPTRIGRTSRALFLVEHARGLVCCRLRRIDSKRFVPYTCDLPYAQVPLELGREARLRGIVDIELRRMGRSECPEVPAALANFSKPEPLASVERSGELGNWIRTSRIRSGLHFREASLQTAHIAKLMRDSRYFIASGSLSDYETTNRPPRHIHKILSLCALYGLEFQTFLERCGLPLEQLGRDPFPDHLWPRQAAGSLVQAAAAQDQLLSGSLSLRGLVEQLSPLPHFLAAALSRTTGLSSPSLHDVFWLDGTRASIHSRLQRSLFALVDRRKKRPRTESQRPASEQSLYVLLKRDGTFLCGRCTAKGPNLFVHPFADGLSEPLRFRNRVDAEVVGQVVVIVRRVLPGN